MMPEPAGHCRPAAGRPGRGHPRCLHLAGLWPAGRCEELLARVERAWDRLAPGAADFVPQASSLRLRAIPGLDLQGLAGELLAEPRVASPLGRWAGALQLLQADCWIRRQPAPARARPPHRPHAWHQDGALGFDFMADPRRDARPRALVTCWIALQDCGEQAPGLEWIDVELQHLLRPEALHADAVAARFPACALRRPCMAAGDALLFDGSVLHRTAARPDMTRDRTSIELRFEAGPG